MIITEVSKKQAPVAPVILIFTTKISIVFQQCSVQKEETIKAALQTPHFEGVTRPEGCADASPSSEIDISLFAKATVWLK